MITKVKGPLPGGVGDDHHRRRSRSDPTSRSSSRVASVDTGNPDRDGHLRSADFFDADTYPTITFRSTSVEPGTSGTWAVTGALTVRYVTRPVTLQVDFDGANASPFGDERIGFSAATDVDREDWGLTWNVALETGGMLVGKRVRIELNVQAVASPRP